MKRFLRPLSFFLAFITAASLLAACNFSEGSNETESTESELVSIGQTEQYAETEEAPKEKEPLTVKLKGENGKLIYNTVRYPANASEALVTALEGMIDKINALTNGNAALFSAEASDKIIPASDDFEIIVGDLPYEECRELSDTVLYGDYHIASVGSKIVIAAYTDDELIRAIKHITGVMLNKRSEDGDYLCEISDYSYRAQRLLRHATVNGINVENFSIAYGTRGTDTEANLEAAKSLRGHISKALGILLPIIKDTDKSETEHKIFVGTQFSGLEAESSLPKPAALYYECKSIGEDYFIVGGGGISLKAAVSALITEFFARPTESGSVNVTDLSGSCLRVADAPRADGSDMRVMTYNILADRWTDYMPVSLRYEPFKAIIDVYSPDIVGLQEVCQKWINHIYNGIGNDYGIIHSTTPDGKNVNFSVIIYKKARFDVIKKGLEYLTPEGPNYIRLVNWVILKDKQTGKLVAFFNTHWDSKHVSHGTDTARIINKVMAENPDVKYAFSTGDYNSKPGAESYNILLTQTGLLNSMDVARTSGTLKNDVGGCAEVGKNKETATTFGPIDHIMISKNISVLAFETILWNKTEQLSDHSAKYADVYLN